MYESPIEIIYGQFQTQLDGDIFRAVQKAGILVNKEELTKALQYDRDQYAKGRRDGIREYAERLKDNLWDLLTLSDEDGIDDYVHMEELKYLIDSIVKEMTGETHDTER